jgi:hypothetical protein
MLRCNLVNNKNLILMLPCNLANRELTWIDGLVTRVMQPKRPRVSWTDLDALQPR